MNANNVKIQELFQSNTTMKIPFFQRPYVWDEGNWDQFLSDMKSLADSNDNYSMGCVLLKKAGKNELGYEIYNVIDGQQRLTTFVIFSKILYNMADRRDMFRTNFLMEDTDKSILVPSRVDADDFNEIIRQEIPADIESNGQIARAYNYMRAKMRKDGFAEISNTLYRKVKNQVEFVKLVLDDKEDEQLMFERLNARGRVLTTGDKLKNNLLDRDNVELYDQLWAPVFESLYDNFWNNKKLGGRNNVSNNEMFFYQFLLLMANDSSLFGIVSAADKLKYRKQDRLYESYMDMMRKHDIAKEQLVREIVKYAKLYKENFGDDVLDKAVGRVPAISRLNMLMHALGSWAPVPYALYVLANVASSEEQDRIFSYLENYLVRRIICDSKNNSYSDLFAEYLIGRKVTTQSQLKTFLTDPTRGDLVMPSDDDVKAALSENDLHKEAKTLLYLLESKQNVQFMAGDFDNAFSELESEPVRPLKSCVNWPVVDGIEEEAQNLLAHTLGNFTLIRDGKLSKKSSSLAWTQKRNLLKERSEGLEMGRIHNFQTWTNDDIRQRNAGLADLICKHWKA